MHARSEATGRCTRGGARPRAQADRAHAADVGRAARRLIALALVASCSRSAPPAPPPPPPVVVVGDAAVADALITSQQVLTAIVPDWSSTVAELRLWQRDGAAWKLAMGPWPGVVGTSGTAWGVGLHGSGPPPGLEGGPVKREGDGKSPAGVFAFRRAYGYSAATSPLGYQVVDANWKCVDDPKSAQYTKVFDASGAAKDWSSAEDMRRDDELYKFVVDVAHNPSATPGAGSCIFLHVWRGPKSATVGCTAMDEGTLAKLIAQLQPSATFVLLPRAHYDSLRGAWGLP